MDADAVLLANGNLRIKRTRYGLMAYNINDFFIGRSFDYYGEYSYGEARVFAQLAARDSWVVDVGANIGAHTLCLSRAVGPRGVVVALEPQRMNYQLLCANLALNEINNVRALHVAAGRAPGQTFVAASDQTKPGNFGGVALSDKAGDPVGVVTIDGMKLPGCQFMKIDVEGQEQSVIAGAAQTIARFKPVLYVENDRRKQSSALIRQILDLDYVPHWDLQPLYSKDNFYKNPKDVFPGIVSIDMLCLPKTDTRKIVGMRPVAGPDDWPLPD
jgi:FkbM family methyltransferase